MMGWNEAESAAINAMLPRVESALFGVATRRHRGEMVSDQEEAILVCRAALTALLEATQSETCATCGGTGNKRPEFGEYPVAGFEERCKACDGSGRVPGAPLVLLAPRQVNGMKQGVAFVTFPEPLYATQTEEKQT